MSAFVADGIPLHDGTASPRDAPKFNAIGGYRAIFRKTRHVVEMQIVAVKSLSDGRHIQVAS
ncbi:hypothetical protein CAK95_26580 [Pseudorhodoplanes sinuspersici]|uniref:Uncharacterized protein n=1 Tax=Pseudorhodoplanes sinuspersici TaxID=1235591 RepID=A0A1W6ZXX3_9HYPH|nr:hypothetical protein CAK95_26580 [Pseudorhodoplanes sinuspersici]